MAKPIFKLNQDVSIPSIEGGAIGVIVEMKLSMLAEPAYFVVGLTGEHGAPPARWHWQTHLVAFNAVKEVAAPMAQLRSRRRKTKR